MPTWWKQTTRIVALGVYIFALVEKGTSFVLQSQQSNESTHSASTMKHSSHYQGRATNSIFYWLGKRQTLHYVDLLWIAEAPSSHLPLSKPTKCRCWSVAAPVNECSTCTMARDGGLGPRRSVLSSRQSDNLLFLRANNETASHY